MADAPRSRRPTLQILGGEPGGNCPRRTSPTKNPLLPQTFFDKQNETVSVDTSISVEKKTGGPIQAKRILLTALAGTLLFTVMLTLNAHFTQSVVLAQSNSTIITTSKKNQTSGRLRQQLILQELSSTGFGPKDQNTITVGGASLFWI